MGSVRPRGLDAIALLLCAAVAVVIAPHVAFQVDRLLFATDPKAAVDLGLRVTETAAWWRGDAVYLGFAHAVYPPHAYLLLRGLLGAPVFEIARVAWAVQLTLLAGVCGWAFVRFGGGAGGAPRWLAVVPLLLASFWQGVGNGQLHLLPVVAGCAAVVLAAGGNSRARDAGAAALMVLALIKPTVSLALLGLLVVVPGRMRPALLTGVLLLACTGLATALQPDSTVDLLGQFVDLAVMGAEHGSFHGGTSNAMTWLSATRVPEVGAVGTLVALGVVTVWAAARGRADVWLLLGVACLVARVSVYHRPYDDVLALPALLALLRAGRSTPLATGLFVVTLLAMAVPGPPLLAEEAIDAWRRGFWVLWALDGLVLVGVVEREHRASAAERED